MTREDILKELKVLDTIGLDRADWMVVYGGAMVMNGIKHETNDVDVSINTTAKQYLEKKGYQFQMYFNGKKTSLKAVITEKLDVFYQGFMTPQVASLTNGDGYYVQTLDSLLVEKIIRDREKDQKDVNLILEKYPQKMVFVPAPNQEQ